MPNLALHLQNLLVLALVVGLSPADATTLVPSPLPLRLTAPEAGAVLVAGSQVTLSWELGADGFGPIEGSVEEWEAFVSVNGGQTYPFRVTPHLDLDLSSFQIIVPKVRSDDVRILLRFGNERHEVGFEVPQRFSIAAPGPLTSPPRTQLPGSTASGRGEAARPGEAGVLAWVDGSRRGRNLSRRVAARRCELGGSRMEAGHLVIPAGVPPRRDDNVDLGTIRSGDERVLASSDRTDRFRYRARALAILLLIQRSNR